MVLGIILAALVLMLAMTTWALNRSLDVVSRAIIEDDLGEYEVFYSRGGAPRLEKSFAAGLHDDLQMMRVIGSDGAVLVSVDLPHYPGAWNSLPSRRLDVGEIAWVRSPMNGQGIHLLLGGLGLKDGGQLWFGRTNHNDQALIERVQRLILGASMIAALLATAPVIWFASHVLRPVRRLIQGAHSLAREERLEQRLQATNAIPELIEFAAAFNASLDRIAALTEELDAANDQLAHELRTPLARIRGNMEAVLTTHDVDGMREAAARGIDEIERAVSLVQTILSIRAGDARSMRLHLEMTSLGQLVSDTVELYQAAAEARSISLQWAPGADAWMMLDQQRIRQALSNLLDNALAYTPEGGTVIVVMQVSNEWATVSVADTGPGLSETDSPRIWRRFSRGSAASASTPGIGLGLSLVRAVANVLHGEADGRSRPEGGAEFWIRLPVTRPVA